MGKEIVTLCPQCGREVMEYIWLYQEKWYCRLECVPYMTRKSPTPRHPSGAIDWESYYEGYYGGGMHQ